MKKKLFFFSTYSYSTCWQVLVQCSIFVEVMCGFYCLVPSFLIAPHTCFIVQHHHYILCQYISCINLKNTQANQKLVWIASFIQKFFNVKKEGGEVGDQTGKKPYNFYDCHFLEGVFPAKSCLNLNCGNIQPYNITLICCYIRFPIFANLNNF